jgi:hypothetical protein
MARFRIRRGPRRIEVDPPHELIGGFLTMEAAGPRVLGEILDGIRRVREGSLAEYSGGWNAHQLQVRADGVQVLESGDYRGGEDLRCAISLAEFEEIVTAWDQQLRRWQGRPGPGAAPDPAGT